VLSIVDAVEGGVHLAACSSSDASCSRGRRCGARAVWRGLQARINEALESKTVASLARR
jgi:DNA-binding IscR family transcriptional regulator